jgi:hypothetical protein
VKPRILVPLVLAAGLAVVAAPACSDPPEPTTCTNIPDGGCVVDYDADYCMDPTCDGLYTCSASGAWVQVGTCPAHPIEAGPDVGDAGDGSTVRDVNLADVPQGAFGGPGCVDLEMPDCDLGVALLCTSSDCCGCQDLYVCVDMNWNLWGECTEAGVVPNP